MLSYRGVKAKVYSSDYSTYLFDAPHIDNVTGCFALFGRKTAILSNDNSITIVDTIAKVTNTYGIDFEDRIEYIQCMDTNKYLVASLKRVNICETIGTNLVTKNSFTFSQDICALVVDENRFIVTFFASPVTVCLYDTRYKGCSEIAMPESVRPDEYIFPSVLKHFVNSYYILFAQSSLIVFDIHTGRVRLNIHSSAETIQNQICGKYLVVAPDMYDTIQVIDSENDFKSHQIHTEFKKFEAMSKNRIVTYQRSEISIIDIITGQVIFKNMYQNRNEFKSIPFGDDLYLLQINSGMWRWMVGHYYNSKTNALQTDQEATVFDENDLIALVDKRNTYAYWQDSSFIQTMFRSLVKRDVIII
jgi:hypothetical protein